MANVYQLYDDDKADGVRIPIPQKHQEMLELVKTNLLDLKEDIKDDLF